MMNNIIMIIGLLTILGLMICLLGRFRDENKPSDEMLMGYMDQQHELIDLLTKQVKLINESVNDLEKRQTKFEKRIGSKIK